MVRSRLDLLDVADREGLEQGAVEGLCRSLGLWGWLGLGLGCWLRLWLGRLFLSLGLDLLIARDVLIAGLTLLGEVAHSLHVTVEERGRLLRSGEHCWLDSAVGKSLVETSGNHFCDLLFNYN